MGLGVWLKADEPKKNFGYLPLNSINISTSSAVAGKTSENCFNGAYSIPAAQISQFFNKDEFSICFWYYPNRDDAGSGACIFGTGGMTAPNNRRYTIYAYPTFNDLHLSWQNEDSNSTFLGVVIKNVFPLKTWTHCAITYKNPTCKVYINGVLTNTYTGVQTSLSFPYGYNIGGSDTVLFDDIRIYNNCISHKEIRDAYKASIFHINFEDEAFEPLKTNVSPDTPYISTTCYNASNGKYGYDSETKMSRTIGMFQGRMCSKIAITESGSNAWPYIFFNNITPQSQNAYRTLSFSYYPTILTALNFYSYNTPGNVTWKVNGVSGSGGNITGILLNQWNFIEVTIQNTGTATAGFGYCKIGTAAHTSNTSNYWLITDVRVEEGNYSTGKALYSGSSTTFLRTAKVNDSSGFGNDVIPNGSITVASDGKPGVKAAKFNGSSYFSRKSLPAGKIKAYSVWIKTTSAPSSNAIVFVDYNNYAALGFYGTTGFIVKARETNSVIPYGTYTANQWNNIIVNYENDGTIKAFINGVKVNNLSSNNYWSQTTDQLLIGCRNNGSLNTYFNGEIADLEFFATQLTEDDAKHMYHSKINILPYGGINVYNATEFSGSSGSIFDANFNAQTTGITEAATDKLKLYNDKALKSSNFNAENANFKNLSVTNIYINSILNERVCNNNLQTVVDDNFLKIFFGISDTSTVYDKNIYTEPDGTRWIRLFHHTPSSGLFATSDDFTSAIYKGTYAWSNMHLFNTFFQASKNFELMIKQKPTASGSESKFRWIQHESPMRATYYQVGTANVTQNSSSGYTTTVHAGLYCAKVNGGAGGNTYLSTNNGSYSNWWGAVGCYNNYSGGIPGWNSVVVKDGYIDVYIRFDIDLIEGNGIMDSKKIIKLVDDLMNLKLGN